jgi:hypothetical protein
MGGPHVKGTRERLDLLVPGVTILGHGGAPAAPLGDRPIAATTRLDRRTSVHPGGAKGGAL